ncbi:tRNA lysidine(34) synthetase TilS [Dictyobacter kobayashii]|uniref:tRNA(Ile)-lysidine synthase n=1 Tax=Dictyobacter kobayashii TaxID=2014872 RepID=A0A402AJA3_9CHLR|nr:tRNA lysidine(34) synthetase TilS [Dictyobacter kobayashii]GCE19169.1 tRNA(Ile)-lysidine synthase [Dictyobacter kobayashii]
MLETIASTIEEFHLLPDQGIVVVAVSGGADSLCLLHVLHRLCGPGRRYPQVALQVAHLNHQLRGEASTQDAEAVARLAHSWQLPVTVGSVDVASLAVREHRSLEEAARMARYRFLREVAQGQPISVAHHLDDQVETLLLHWLRGGGIASMVGLQPRQQDIIRPLLAVSHADTLAYCAQHQLLPIEDASNSDVRFLRNRIRHELLPLLEDMNPGFRETLLRNAEVLHVDFDWINTQVDQQWPEVVLQEQADNVQLSIPRLKSLSPSLQHHLLRRASARLCDGQSPLEARHYHLLDQLLQRPATREIVTLHLPQHLHTIRRGDILVFKYISEQASEDKKAAPLTEATLALPGSVAVPGSPWTALAEWVPENVTQQVQTALHQKDWATVWNLLPTTPYAVYVDAETLLGDGSSPNLYVRTRREGDRLQPLGMNQEKKVKAVMIDRHIPREERASLPLFFSGSRCIWLGGIQLDHRVRLTEATRKIIRLSITKRT